MLQESPTTTTVRAPSRLKAISLLTAICSGFVLLLLTQRIFTRPVENPPAFELFWPSGAAVARGANPYVIYPETFISHMFISGTTRPVAEINMNPPCVLPLFQILSRFPIQQFAHGWAVVNSLLLVCIVGFLMWYRPDLQQRQIFWMFASQAVVFTLTGSQIYFLLFLLATFAMVFIERDNELAAAIAIGLIVAVKPTMAYWPFFLYLTGRRRLAIRSSVVALMFSAAPLLLYGTWVYRDWFYAAIHDNHWIIPTDMAIPAYFARIGLRFTGVVLAVAVAMLLSWFVYKRKPDFNTTTGIALCAGILCAPLSWTDYVLLLTPYFVSFRWKLPSTLAAFFLTIPVIIPSKISRSPGHLGVGLGSGIYFGAFWIILFIFLSRAGYRLYPAVYRSNRSTNVLITK